LKTLTLVLVVLAVAWAYVAAVFAAVAWVRRVRFERAGQRSFDPPSGARLLLARPCAGHEATLERCLLSIRHAKHSFPVEVVVGVAYDDDEALPAVRRACAELRRSGYDARVEVVSPRGANHKVSTLAGILETSTADLVMNADSNVDLGGYDLDAMVAELESDSSIGVVWAPHNELRTSNALGSRACEAVLAGSYMAFNLLCALHPHGMSGKLWLTRRSMLLEIGGFADMVDYLGEDLEMVRRLLERGRKVVPTAQIARTLGRRMNVREVVLRVSRWMSVVRAQDPRLLPTYPLLFANLPLIAVVASVAGFGYPGWAALAVLMALLARMAVSLNAQVHGHRRASLVEALIDSVLADLVILAAFVRALRVREVVWRNRQLRVGPRGRVEAL
jgi:ceramide glucosyltransferase